MMPVTNGIDTARFLRDQQDDGFIIFLTAERNYAVESYQVHAFYYLLKPADTATLSPLLDKCIENIRSEGSDTITVNGSEGLRSIPVSDINYVCIRDRRAQYHLTDGSVVETVTLRIPFKTLVQELVEQSRFVMCGAALVINVMHVREVNWEEVAHFKSGEKISLPHAAAETLKKALRREG